MTADQSLPLDGMLVVDASRLLPGGILARQLLDLGARLIKIEEPGTGDPMRMVPPLIDGIGVGFATLFRGAESVCLDLDSDSGQAHLRSLVARADVLVESFRPGTMSGWDLGYEALAEGNPRLVWCSLSAFGRADAVRNRLAHDLNLVALSGALEAMGPGQPVIQLADVGAGLLAASSILAALLRRERTGRGARVDQPLVTGSLPFVTWRWAEAAAGRERVVDLLLGGAFPCYRVYRCAGGERLAVSALEPKFWIDFTALIGLDDLAAAGFSMGDEGAAVVEHVEAVLVEHGAGHWSALAETHGLPVSVVHSVDSAREESLFEDAEVIEVLPTGDGSIRKGVGPWQPGVGRTPARPAPALGEHTDAILRKMR